MLDLKSKIEVWRGRSPSIVIVTPLGERIEISTQLRSDWPSMEGPIEISVNRPQAPSIVVKYALSLFQFLRRNSR